MNRKPKQLACEACCLVRAEIMLHFRGELARELCFACADKAMCALAIENVKSGATIEDTAAGYAAWRELVKRPVSPETARAVAESDK